MKMIITTNDIKSLTGKFVLQVDNDEPDYTITDKNWNFVSEKRLRLVCGLVFVGLYYMGHEPKDEVQDKEQDFVDYFNGSGKYENYKRFHRLLTSKELDFVLSKMKERNY